MARLNNGGFCGILCRGDIGDLGKKAADGDFYEFFSNDEKQRNEPIDCRVYSLAGERWMKPQYAKIGEKYAEKAENKELDTPESYGATRNYILDT
jgi:phage terminase large subunit GpA-like protein